jgi:hypothetical protein
MMRRVPRELRRRLYSEFRNRDRLEAADPAAARHERDEDELQGKVGASPASGHGYSLNLLILREKF